MVPLIHCTPLPKRSGWPARSSCSLDLITVQHWLSREAAEAELGKRGWQAAEKALALLAATATAAARRHG